MPKVDVRTAEFIAARDSVGKCKTCTDLADEGKDYCRNCESYWEDCRAGLFDDYFEVEDFI